MSPQTRRKCHSLIPPQATIGDLRHCAVAALPLHRVPMVLGPVNIGAIALESPVVLAPLAGITDPPFRALVSRLGAGMVVSEMVASQEMVQARASTRMRAEIGPDDVLTSVQIAGRQAHWMAECARLCADRGARIIDINMGCPAKKVTNGASGSALMQDLDHALTLVDAVVAAVDVPVTLKMRLGWDEASQNADVLAKRAEAAGVQVVTVHGRTRSQFFRGHANWGAIRKAQDAVSVPLIANGDIIDAVSAKTALKASGASAVMIGRGAQGQPWILNQVAAALAGKPQGNAPKGGERADLIAHHYDDMLSFYGTDLGVRVARKHLGWYLDHIPGGDALRSTMMREPDPRKVHAAIRSLADLGPELRSAA